MVTGSASVVWLVEYKSVPFYSVCSTCCCQVSLSYVVPPIIMFLNKHPMVAKADLSSLSRLVCGAASIGREMIEEFHSKNPNCHIGQGSFQVIIFLSTDAIKRLIMSV